MTPVLDTRRLRYFVAIAEAGSFSAAARHLAVAQPALSHHVKALEAEIGEPLFERVRHGVVLTEAGQVLLGHARGILDAIARAQGEFTRRRRAAMVSRRTVRLSVIPSFSPSTAEIIAAAARELPGLDLYVTEALTLESHRMIEAGRLDLAVNLADERWPLGRPLVREAMYAVSMPNPGAKGGIGNPVRLEDLCRARLVLPSSGEPDRRLVERLARQAGLALDIAHEMDGLVPRIQAVIAGLGTTISALVSIWREVEAGTLLARPIVEPAVTRLVVLEVRPGFDPAIAQDLHAMLPRLLGRFACGASVGGMRAAGKDG